MSNKKLTSLYSLLACILISSMLIQYRASHFTPDSKGNYMATSWDAFGYYLYLPGTFIYNDLTQLEWLPEIDQKYAVTGGHLYQAHKYTNGNYVGKYLGGVALMELPFFFIGHAIALNSDYPADGFSAPYQYAIVWGAVCYAIFAFFFLRYLLLRYFSDSTTAISLLLLALATNLFQYIAVAGAMSHAFIFPLYALVIYTTIKWHEKPALRWAFFTGLIIGLATICRPTEAIMLFIPLLWDTQTKEHRKLKWEKVRLHKSHILLAALGGLIGILPQLIYWKFASGSFVYNVGSKWSFLNPFFRVLIGFENGWFVYTPITIFFVAGLFFIKKYPFKRAFTTFCLLNIWIIISWFDWKYGATYSTRALVQSYPVFAFPFAAVVERIRASRWKYPFYALGLFLIGLNFFQLRQYDQTILHFRDMNWKYYSHIFLNSHPTPLDMSLLDTDEFLHKESTFEKTELISTSLVTEAQHPDHLELARYEFPTSPDQPSGDSWLKVTAEIECPEGFFGGQLKCSVQLPDSSKTRGVRLANPLSVQKRRNQYAFYMKLPKGNPPGTVRVFLEAAPGFQANVYSLTLSHFHKKQK
ncbi:MAG: glycosyltransferase family 39 protein [Saprospiraceae bacterium]